MLTTIYKYFPDLNLKQKQRFEALGPLYKDWNSKINVISKKDIDNLYIHHVLHSLAIAKVINFAKGGKILDVGTGGGFPGLPLAIMFPKVNFLLVDSVAKKIKVAGAVASEVGLSNVQIKKARVEDLDEQFDFTLARAVTRLDTAWGWVHPNIKKESKNQLPNGLFYLKSVDTTDELPKSVKHKTWPLDDFFNEEYFRYKALHLLNES